MSVQVLSIVWPSVENIIAGNKRYEIHSSTPPELSLKTLVLVK